MNLNNRRHLLSEGSMHVWYRYHCFSHIQSAQFDASRRGKKGLKSSLDIQCKAQTLVGWRGKSLLRM